MARFDEIELQPAIFGLADTEIEPPPPLTAVGNDRSDRLPAHRFRRLLALFTDLSLFAALSLALSPLLPPSMSWLAVSALAAFVVLVSFYYFAGCWLLWGKTIGGTIFDVKVIAVNDTAMTFKNAVQRWLGVYLSLATGGIGFALAALPSRLSLPDRLSATCCVRSN